MTIHDPSVRQLRAALSTPLPMDDGSLSRRHFLQAVAAGVSVAMLPSWMADAAGAAPAAPGTGKLVYVMLDGGSDGLHMIPPVGQGAYHDARGSLALSAGAVLPLGSSRGFHPALRRLKARYDAGDVAIIDGVGNPARDLSHFSAMADHERGGATSTFGWTGWIGRYLDETATGPLHGIALGNRVPMLASGRSRSAITLPASIDRLPMVHRWTRPVERAVASIDGAPTGRGELCDTLASATASLFETAVPLRPAYPTQSGSGLAGELRLCANLLNADIGAQVLAVRHGPYDSHTGQADLQQSRMAELDEAIEAFFTTLDAAHADDVTVVCVSEFGRRVAANGGGGTDHGAGNSVLAIGRRVTGGFHGALPSLTRLTRDGNLSHDIDYRSIHATLLHHVLGVDPASVLGGSFELVPFLGERTPDTPPTPTTVVPPAPAPPPPPPPPAPAPKLGRPINTAEADVLRLYRAFFDREPDPSGARYWLDVHALGHGLDELAQWFSDGREFSIRYQGTSNATYLDRVYRNVLGRRYDRSGYLYWLGILDAGELNRAGVVRWIAASEEFRRRYPYTRLPI